MVGGIDSEGEQLMDVSIERASHCNECRDQTRRWSGLSWTGKQGVRLFLFFLEWAHPAAIVGVSLNAGKQPQSKNKCSI
jgi:hypothetical protein